ncbi:MAG: hypothetical protein R3C44_10655 [Chloroflexota bacterium]
MGQQRRHQITQARRLSQVASITPQVNPGQYRLLISGPGKSLHFGHNVAQCPALTCAPCHRGDTKCAAIVAAVLDLDETTGAPGAAAQPFAEQRFAIKLGRSIRLIRVEDGDEIILGGILHNANHAG